MKDNSRKYILLSTAIQGTDTILDAEKFQEVFNTFKTLKLSGFLAVDPISKLPSNATIEVVEALFDYLSLKLKAEVGSAQYYSRVLLDPEEQYTILSMSYDFFVVGVEGYKAQLEKSCVSLIREVNDLTEELDMMRDLTNSVVRPLKALI